MAVDLELIERLFADMRRKQAILEGYRQMSRAEFEGDPGRILAVEHALQTMIQSLIDIGLHLLAHVGRKDLESYADAIRALGEEKILDEELLAKLKGMPGFRNILVHGYTRVDENLVLTFMRERLGDFSEYEREVRAFLEAGQ